MMRTTCPLRMRKGRTSCRVRLRIMLCSPLLQRFFHEKDLCKVVLTLHFASDVIFRRVPEIQIEFAYCCSVLASLPRHLRGTCCAQRDRTF